MDRFSKHPVTTAIYWLDDFVTNNRNMYASRIGEDKLVSLIDSMTNEEKGYILERASGLTLPISGILNAQKRAKQRII